MGPNKLQTSVALRAFVQHYRCEMSTVCIVNTSQREEGQQSVSTQFMKTCSIAAICSHLLPDVCVVSQLSRSQ